MNYATKDEQSQTHIVETKSVRSESAARKAKVAILKAQIARGLYRPDSTLVAQSLIKELSSI